MRITIRSAVGTKVDIDTEDAGFTADGVDTLFRQVSDLFRAACEIDAGPEYDEADTDAAEPDAAG